MLEDIKKTIPRLDENDAEKMYNNIVNRSKKTKVSIINKKMILAFSSFIMLLAAIISISIIVANSGVQSNTKTNDNNTTIDEGGKSDNDNVGGDSTKPNQGNDNGNNDNQNNHTSYNVSKDFVISDRQILGMAAFNEFDKKDSIKLTSLKINTLNESTNTDNEEESDETINGYLKVSYPFDYVKIKRAFKFSIDASNINDEYAKEIISVNCGLGELEVVVAKFVAYYYDGTNMIPCIDDTLISIRGYNGYYTILENCWQQLVGVETYVFSSHKIITENSVDKDFTPPFVQIFVRIDGNNRYVYFKTSDVLLDSYGYDHKYAIKNIGVVETISGDTLYSVLSLTEFKTKTVEATVVAIDDENLIVDVETDTNLKKVYISKYTVGNGVFVYTDGEQIFINLRFEKGSKILVEYCVLFLDYDPEEVLATDITIVTEN